MPKLLFARPPQDEEERQIRKLAGSRHAPGDWIARALMIVRSWQRRRAPQIAAELDCHPQTVRERLQRFNVEGIEGLGDRPGPGRKSRLSEAERGAIIALARTPPPGRLVRQPDGAPAAPEPERPACWTLDALAEAAQRQGIQIGRSQVRRILLLEPLP